MPMTMSTPKTTTGTTTIMKASTRTPGSIR